MTTTHKKEEKKQEETHKKEEKKKDDKGLYKIRRQDRECIGAVLENMESLADRIAAISSLYNRRCLINNPKNKEDLDVQLRKITADSITDMRASFDKLAAAEDLLERWIGDNRPSFLGRFAFFS